MIGFGPRRADGLGDATVPRLRGQEGGITSARGGRTGRMALLAGCWIAVVALFMSGDALVRSAAIVRETGRGMLTTVRPGEDLIVARGGNVRRGDVVVLPGPAGKPVITRVIAMPGDQVACCDAAGRVMVDGRSLNWDDEALSKPPPGTAYSLTLGSDQIWVLGDNRASAADSRTWGPIAASEVEGRAIATWRGGLPGLLRTPDAFTRDGLATASAAIPGSVGLPAAAAVAAAAALFALALTLSARRLIRRSGNRT